MPRQVASGTGLRAGFLLAVRLASIADRASSLLRASDAQEPDLTAIFGVASWPTRRQGTGTFMHPIYAILHIAYPTLISYRVPHIDKETVMVVSIERRQQNERRHSDYGPPQGSCERRRHTERRLPELVEATISDSDWEKLFGRIPVASTTSVDEFDQAAEVFGRARD
jgi:hypothetical protein